MTTTINVLVSSISHMPLWYVWRDSGVAAEHGIELQLDVAGWDLDGRPVRSMADRAPALLAGEYQFLSGLHHDPYLYRARGDKRLTYLAQGQNDWDDRLVVGPEIQTAADLDGETVLVTSRAPCVKGNLYNVLAKAGADPDRIEFHALPKPPDFRRRLKEVAAGEAAGAQVDIPFDRMATEFGLRVLELPPVPVVHNVTLCADQTWTARNRPLTTEFLKSMIDAIHFFKTQPDEVEAILSRTICPPLDIRDEADISHLASSWASLLSAKPYPHPLAVWNVYALDVAKDPEVNHVDPLEPWDLSFLREIDDSGYIDELYGSLARSSPVTPLI